MKKLLFCIIALAATIPTSLFGTEILCSVIILANSKKIEFLQKFNEKDQFSSVFNVISDSCIKNEILSPIKIHYYNHILKEFRHDLAEPEKLQLTLKQLGFSVYTPIIVSTKK